MVRSDFRLRPFLFPFPTIPSAMDSYPPRFDQLYSISDLQLVLCGRLTPDDMEKWHTALYSARVD
ncbi:MAG TPA: hypothetical protein ENJ30_01905, partial [Desulfobulbaceae bacterium]|nr:hypothetical protein [Desulfobulbaceae bacterium]